MKKLKQYIFERKVNRHLTDSQREKRWIDYKNAKNILLLFESDFVEKNRFIRKAIETLTSEGKKVSAWGFLDTKKSVTAILPSFKVLDRETINWYGQPKEPFLRELAETEFDLLIDLTLCDILPLMYVGLYANAASKVGMSRTMDNIYDFKIIVPEPEEIELNNDTKKKPVEFRNLNEMLFHTDQQYLFDQIIFYLKRIQSRD